MVFECLDCTFGGIQAMVVWLDQHQITLFWGDVLFYDSACLIVHDIQFDAISFSMEQFILLFICHEDDVVAKAHYGKGHDCICLVVVYDEEAHVALKGHKWKCTGEVIVQYPSLLVCKCSKARQVVVPGILLSLMILEWQCVLS
jgi:hypothetical protein